MTLMKNLRIAITTFLLIGLGISCTDESTYPVPFNEINNNNAGILKIISQGTAILTSDIPNSKYEVTFEANDAQRGKAFTKVELYVSYNDQTDNSLGSDKPEELLATYTPDQFTEDPDSGLPRITMTQSAQDIMDLLGVTLPEIINGKDQFIFRQAMYLPNGIVSTSTNVSVPIAAAGGVYGSPFQNVVTIFVCASGLEGPVNYVNVVTGAVVPITACLPSISGSTNIVKQSHGEYLLDDATFGQYDCAWNDSPASGVTWTDFCDQITVGGSDQYGLVYGYILVSNDGTELVLDWFNDYGDTGTVTLTRAGGWPLGLIF